MKKINLFILVLLLCNSCNKYDEQKTFDITVKVNDTEFQIGEEIRITIEGGMKNSLIYPVLAKYNSNGDVSEYIELFDNSNSPSQYQDCCTSEGIGGPYSTSWISDGLICNCDIDGVIVHTPDSYQTSSGGFYWGEDKFKVLIIDPFIVGDARVENADKREPSNDNIICESEEFSINNISSTCNSPQNLTASFYNDATVSYVTFTWDIVSDAYKYNVRYKRPGDPTWDNGTSYTNVADSYQLDPNTEYEFQVQTVCNQSGTEVSAWASNTFSTLSSTPCYVLNCGSLSQLSDYEAYTSNGSSSWTSEWVINSDNGSNNGSYYATQGNYCVGGFIEFNINLSSPSRMSYYGRINNYTAASAQIKVDGISFGQVTLPSDIFDINYFGHYMTNDFISAGNHTIRLEFPAGGTFNRYYLDEIEFFCE